MTNIPTLREVLALVESLKGPLTRGEAEKIADKLYLLSTDRESWLDVVAALGGGRSALGAVVALVEREMPGLSWNIEKRQIGPIYVARIWDGPIDGWDCFVKTSHALALLAAYLRALIAELEQAGQRAGKAS